MEMLMFSGSLLRSPLTTAGWMEIWKGRRREKQQGVDRFWQDRERYQSIWSVVIFVSTFVPVTTGTLIS
jgi:hypothetical protein